MTKPNDNPGTRLRAARERLGFTSTQAARLSGIEPQLMYAYEKCGKVASLDQLHRLALAIGADPHEIDPRLCPSPEAGPRTLTLVFERFGDGPECSQLVPADTDADMALFREVLDELVGTITPKTIAGLVLAARLARVKLVIRTDLVPPAPPAPTEAPRPAKRRKEADRPA